MVIVQGLKTFALITVAMVVGAAQVCVAQENSGEKSWTATSQQQDPSGVVNPSRTTQTHTEVGGRIVDKTSVETLGPDGRYIPYSDTERESVRVDGATVRNVERTFGRGPDGQRTLVQEKQEESRSLPGGAEKVVRTVLSPDGNGKLQVAQRELQDSKQISPGVRETKTTVLTLDSNGGLSPAAQIDERQKQSSDGTVEYKKSTLLSDGTGKWQLSEVREATTKEEAGKGRTKEERVLRPDSEGKFKVVERTVTKQADARSGEKRETVETYSNNVPGTAGDGSLQLIQRETTVHRGTSGGDQKTTRQVERLNWGDPADGLHVTKEAIDIVRPGENGVAREQHTIVMRDSNDQVGQVWVDLGKTNKPAAVQVDTRPAVKPQ